MAGDFALRIAITGANGNLGRKLIAAFLAAPDIAAIHAIDRNVAGLSPQDARLLPIQADLRAPGTRERACGHRRGRSSGGAESLSGRLMGRCGRFLRYDRETSEACAKASVSRLVFASSNHVMGGYKDTPVALSDGGLATDLPPRVGTLVKTSEGLIDSTAYAAAKLMGERVLAVKAETGAFTAVLLRIGWCQPGENSPETISAAGTPKSSLIETDPEREHDLRWFKAMWLSNGDLVRAVFAAVRADASAWPSPAILVNAMSANRPSPWDLSAGRKLIGYQPIDDVSSYGTPVFIQ